MTGLLEIRNVSRSFSGLRVLNNVSFAVAAGGITGLIGPNGAGKSTLFNIVSGFLATGAGQVLYRGRDLDRMSIPARSRAGLVRTFQTPQVFPNLTVQENIPALLKSLRLVNDLEDSVRNRFSKPSM